MDKVTKRQGPVLIALDDASPPSPALAPAVPDDARADGRAMQTVLRVGARSGSRIGRWFLASALSLTGFLVSLAAWNYVTALLASQPVLGWIATALFAAFLLTALALAVRELAAYARLARLDRLHQMADNARSTGDLPAARATTDALARLYHGRADLAWAADRVAGRAGDIMDGESLLNFAETEFMTPLDQAARREIENAARQVAAVTALVPLALADVVAALFANLRMVRRIAEIYGGHAGTFGSLRLMRAVMVHLVATGAVAVGDDLIHSVAGGGLLSKLSRRFGEGVINGALTARVGVAAMEVCRPMPFVALPRPKITNLMSRGLAGLFGAAKAGGTSGQAGGQLNT